MIGLCRKNTLTSMKGRFPSSTPGKQSALSNTRNEDRKHPKHLSFSWYPRLMRDLHGQLGAGLQGSRTGLSGEDSSAGIRSETAIQLSGGAVYFATQNLMLHLRISEAGIWLDPFRKQTDVGTSLIRSLFSIITIRFRNIPAGSGFEKGADAFIIPTQFPEHGKGVCSSLRPAKPGTQESSKIERVKQFAGWNLRFIFTLPIISLSRSWG